MIYCTVLYCTEKYSTVLYCIGDVRETTAELLPSRDSVKVIIENTSFIFLPPFPPDIDFIKDISDSRTFCLFTDIKKIKNLGLAKGGSLDNAIVVDNNKVLNIFDMPVMSEGKKNKRQLNSALLVNLLKENIISNEEVAVIVEQVNAMPGQGVTSMFNFGQTFGAIKGICAALDLPIFFVRPSKWKKHFELINSSKDSSRTKAIEMYPKLSNQLAKKKDVNKSDAILIARFFSETRFTEEN